MDLIEEIIGESVKQDVPLPVLLRKCLVVAAKLRNDRLKTWASSELNGFETKVGLPPYRVVAAPAVGVLVNPVQAISDNPIPPALLEEKHREFATTAYLLQGIGALESLLEVKDDRGRFTIDWPANLVAYYQRKIADGYALNRAHQVLPRSVIVGICDTVRNRLLELAIEIQAEVGILTKPPEGPARERVERSVTNIIYGGQNVIGSQIGGGIAQASDSAVIQGDFSTLSKALEQAGVGPEDLKDLRAAMESDASAHPSSRFGGSVSQWIARLGAKVATASGNIAAGAVQSAATAAIKAYLGIPM